MLKKIAPNMMLIINQVLMMKLKKHIKDKQKIIKQRFKSLLQTKKTIKKILN